MDSLIGGRNKKCNKMDIFNIYKEYLEVYPEWFIIKKYIEGEDITICSLAKTKLK